MDPRYAFEQAVLRVIESEAGFATGARILVAVSGGPDSTALLTVLHRLVTSGRLAAELAVAHLNHRLRSSASDRDALFTQALARSLGLRCFVGEERGLAGPGGDLEARARRARLGFLRRVATAWDAKAICLGHTRDDQAETLLLRLARGGGPASLAAMQVRRSDGIVRPLLGFSRRECAAYRVACGAPAVRDASNDDERFTRNRVRRRVLPVLEEELGGNIAARLARLAEHLRGEAFLAGERIAELLGASETRSRLAIEVIERAGPGAARLLHAWLGAAGISASTRQVESLLRVARGSRPSGAVDLGHGVRAERRYGELRLVASGPAVATIAPGARDLPIPGGVVLGSGWRIAAERIDVAQATHPLGGSICNRLETVLDAHQVSNVLQARSPVAGDRIRLPFGRRKLSDVLIDARVPRLERAALAIIADRDDILWVPGVTRSIVARPSANTREVVVLRAEKIVAGP